MKKVIFIDDNEKIIKECPIIEIPLHDNKVIEKSIELFNDDEPCIIHKSFSVRAMTFDITNYLKSISDSNNEVLKSSIESKILDQISLQDFYKIKLIN